MQFIGLFPVPLLKFRFSKHEEYQFDDIQKITNKPEGWIVDVNSSFPDISDSDQIIPPFFRDKLKKEILSEISNLFGELNMPNNINYECFWYNIYHENQGQERHCHLSHIDYLFPYWSGIYYNKNATPTTFHRPDCGYKTQVFKGHEKSRIKEAYYSYQKVDVVDGDILLFPPYLDHEVTKKKDNNTRITFSFNIKLNHA
jgi:uncharacterized protein (TIGR02466 family)